MYLDRPRLTRHLDGCLDRSLTAVVAGAGYGKTTLIRAWSEDQYACGHTVTAADRDLGQLARALVGALRTRVPGLPAGLITALEGAQGPDPPSEEEGKGTALAAHLAEALGVSLARDVVVVLDDVQEIDGAPGSAALLSALARHDVPRLHVLAASRHELPFPVERLRGRGAYGELTARDLACTLDETTRLLAAVCDGIDDDVAARVHHLTSGWPAAVRMAAEVLAAAPSDQRLTRLDELPAPGGPLYRYLTEEALAAEAPAVRDLLERLAPFDRVHPGLVDALGLRPAPAGVGDLADLARRGLWLHVADEPGWFTIPAVVRIVLAGHDRRSPLTDDLEAGARWLEAQGEFGQALAVRRRLGGDDQLEAFLVRRGPALLGLGLARELSEAVDALACPSGALGLGLLAAEADFVLGDWEEALGHLRPHATGTGPIPAPVAWRLGIIHHLRGELDQAAATYQRGRLDGEDPADEALLLAWHASLSWLQGDAPACARLASESLRRATACGDDRALATAHTAAAMEAALRSDRAANDAHYLRALDHAAAAHDVLLTIRIRTNRGSRMLEEGYFDEALVELETAISLAELAGYTLFRALALSNRGEVLIALGQLEAAHRDLEAARRLYERLGSRMVAYPLGHLGAVAALRGETALARGCYEEAIVQSEAVGDLQGLVPALAGLAEVLADTDPEAAAAAASRAVGLGPVLGRVAALVASAVVAGRTGDVDAARRWAEEAATLARTRRDRSGLARALEARAAVEPEAAPKLLAEAAQLWDGLGAPIGRARVALARLAADPGRNPREQADDADGLAASLRALGCRHLAEEAAALASRWRDEVRPDIEVTTLGGFGVRRRGVTVASTEWQSRKARDLLKILIAKRGPVPRDQLVELLWPDENDARVPRRLSVTLSTLRAVLDPDKERPADYAVVALDDAVALDLAHVQVDVERFLDLAGRALARADGAEERAGLLAAAEAAYTGDFLVEDLYEEWTIPLRERARAAYLQVVSAWAATAARAGDHAAAASAQLRVLERDPYDEGAHLGLVRALTAAGRHGEARRAYRTYAQRMTELDIEAAPFPTGDLPNPA